MRISAFLPLGSLFLLAGWPACQPTGTNSAGSGDAKKSCGITVVYQNNNDGEIEPCG